jgi:hypothetical protein
VGNPEPEAKASGFLSSMRAIKSVCSEAQWDKLLKSLSPETAEAVRAPPLPVSWMPARIPNELLRKAYDVAFGRRDEPILEAAKIALRGDMGTIYKVFIRLSSPQFVIERGAKLWDTYNRHNGVASSRRSSETSAEIRYSGIVTSFPAFWVYQRGAIIGILEATGLNSPKAVILSGGNREPDAVIEASWT